MSENLYMLPDDLFHHEFVFNSSSEHQTLSIDLSELSTLLFDFARTKIFSSRSSGSNSYEISNSFAFAKQSLGGITFVYGLYEANLIFRLGIVNNFFEIRPPARPNSTFIRETESVLENTKISLCSRYNLKFI